MDHLVPGAERRAQQLGQRHVEEDEVVAVEDDALRVALVEAHPQRMAKRLAHQPAAVPAAGASPCSSAPLTAASSALSAVQRERLGRAEAPAGRRVRPVVAQHAVREREPPRVVEASPVAALGDQPLRRARRGRAAGPPR